MSPSRRRPIGPSRTRLPGPWKIGPIPVIGLVGGIGSGKSVVASRLETLGAFVIDADKVGHALLDQSPVYEQVVSRFGPGVLLDGDVEDGARRAIDRAALGKVVFSDPTARKALETIVHPKMRHTFEKAIGRVARRGECPAVVLDAAILFETGWDSLCDRVIFVESGDDARAARVLAQRGWEASTLAAREKAQWSLDRKREKADAVVLNHAGLDELAADVDRAWALILASKPARATVRRERQAEREGSTGRESSRGRPSSRARGR